MVIFKGVYTIALAKRENDKRIKALYIQMKEVMNVFLQYGQPFLSYLHSTDLETLEGYEH